MMPIVGFDGAISPASFFSSVVAVTGGILRFKTQTFYV